MIIHSEKWHACGNDFILLTHDLAGGEELSKLAVAICRPHEGVGADGIVAFDAISVETGCRIFNLDGSEAEISGNGIRCLAGFLKRNLPGEGIFRIRSKAGLRTLHFLNEECGALRFRADMGEPSFAPSSLPANIDQPEALPHKLQISGRTIDMNLVSVGNPHCVVFVTDLNSEDWSRLGALLEQHPLFPRRTNVEFVRPTDPHTVEVRMWERGVGRTSSSGTGSCAAAVVSVKTGRVQSPVTVRTEKGELSVAWRPGERIFLDGPAIPVWAGEFFWSDE